MKTYSKELGIFCLLLITGGILTYIGTKNSLDTRFYYTGDEARLFLSSLSPEGKAQYLRGEILDFLFMFFYSWLAMNLMKKNYPQLKLLHVLAIVPGIFDNMENTTILYALKDPLGATALDTLGLVTSIKWSVGGVVLIIILAGFFKSKKVSSMGILLVFLFSGSSFAANWAYVTSETKQPIRQKLDTGIREFRVGDRKCKIDEVVPRGDDTETRALICDLENEQKVTTIASCQTRGGKIINQNTGDLSFIAGTHTLSVILLCE